MPRWPGAWPSSIFIGTGENVGQFPQDNGPNNLGPARANLSVPPVFGPIGSAKIGVQVEGALSTSLTGNIPPGLADGDIVIAVFTTTSAAANFVAPGSGWTQLFAPFDIVAGAETLAAYYKMFPTAAGAVGPTASWTTSGKSTVQTVAYGGVDPVTPIDAAAVTAASLSPLVIGSITTVTANARLVMGVGADTASANTIAQPASSPTLLNISTGTGRRTAMAEEIDQATGGSGTRTWTATASLNLAGFIVALRPMTSAVVTVDTGQGSLGLTATATAQKVLTASAVAGIGATGLAVARKVGVDTGRAAFALAGSGASRKVAPETAVALLGAAGLAASRKVAPETAVALLGAAGLAGARKVAPETAVALTGASGLATARHVGTPTARGALGLTATGADKKILTPTAAGSLGLTATGADKKILTPTARGALGLVGTDTARKVTVGTGLGGLGLSAVGSLVHLFTANAGLGLVGLATSRKVAPGTGLGEVGLAGTDTARHVGIPSARGVVGLAGTDTARKVSVPTAAGELGLAGTDTARKVSVPAARGLLGLVGLATSRKVAPGTGASAVGLAGVGASRKVARVTGGPSAFGLSGVGSDTPAGRLLTGLAAVGVAATATARKVVTPTTRGAVGLVGLAVSRKIAPGTGLGALGLAGTDTARKVGISTARGAVGLTGTDTARKVAVGAARGLAGLVGSAGSRKVAPGTGAGAVGLAGTDTARKVAVVTGGPGALGLSSSVLLSTGRAALARAAVGLAGLVREVFHLERARSGGWASLEAVLNDERSYLRTSVGERMLACPYCGEPLIGNVCTFDMIHIAQYGPPDIAEDIMPTDPGPWGSLTGVLRDAASNALDEQHTPEIACPRCGEPLVAGHCTFDGYQSAFPEE